MPPPPRSCQVGAEEAARYLLVPALLPSAIPAAWIDLAWGSEPPSPRFTSLTSMIPAVRALLSGPKSPLAPSMSPLEFQKALSCVRVKGASVYAFHRAGLKDSFQAQYYAVLHSYYRLLVSEHVRVECSDEPFVYRFLLNCEVRRDVPLGQVDYKPLLEGLLVGFRAENGWDAKDVALLRPLGQTKPRSYARNNKVRMGVMGVLGMLPSECDEHAVLVLDSANCAVTFRFPDEAAPLWKKDTLLSVLRPEISVECYEADHALKLRAKQADSRVPAHALPPARAAKFRDAGADAGAASSAPKRPLPEDAGGPHLTDAAPVSNRFIVHQSVFGSLGMETLDWEDGTHAWDGSGSSTGLKRHAGSSQMYYVHTDDPFDAQLHAHVQDMLG